MSKNIILDIETDGLLLDLTTMWVGVTYCIEENSEKVWYFPEKLVEYLQGNHIIGHNILGFDIPALEKLSNIKLNCTYTDTLIMAKLCYYDKDKSWSHSLEAYGERLGFPKGDHNDWTKYSAEMEEYCKRDVQVTLKLYNHMINKHTWLQRSTLEFEQKVQQIITQQYQNGWTFDVKKAKELHIELVGELEQAEKTLFDTFKPLFLPKGPVKEPKKPFKRMGSTTLGPHQPIEFVHFNPSSGAHIVWWVDKLYGKQDWVMTDKNNPKTDADTLEAMFSDKDWAEPLLHYFEVNKILGQLAEGDKAWLKQLRGNKLHGSVDILGTNTGRSTHSSPNLSQVPSVRAYKGKESRALFTHTSGRVNIGCDLSGIELRCLAHYMGDADYTKQLLEGDIHTVNQKAAGLPTRDNAKTFIYGFLYGAGDAKIGKIVNGNSKQGKKLKEQFLAGLPALGNLITKVRKAAKRGYLVGITGRRLHVRSEHSALNVLLQSLGAYVSKQWLIEIHKRCKEEEVNIWQLGHIHDEVQVECYPDDKEKVMKILVESATKAGEILGMRCRVDAEAKEGMSWADCH